MTLDERLANRILQVELMTLDERLANRILQVDLMTLDEWLANRILQVELMTLDERLANRILQHKMKEASRGPETRANGDREPVGGVSADGVVSDSERPATTLTQCKYDPDNVINGFTYRARRRRPTCRSPLAAR
ncbi:hypothetical protein EYF80_034674 [Liparis tanakae]|uniref:Uncharacterized protein n=1 Tax=Liparis tanakae TaxID=230148 RepID=A0A4Z2GPD8_9TELE|nr:hypothetical protein EYF80_034674 [Liparis tanakae]